jgi:hypothetical protein
MKIGSAFDMGMLDRYKKSGGFIQLLTLIETSGAQKREKFLQMIKEESPLWEETLRSHVLTVEHVFSWPQEVLSEITSRIQPINLAGVLKSLPEAEHKKAFIGQTPMNRRKIEEFFNEKVFTPSEILVATEKFLIETRILCTQGVIKLDKVDHNLFIEDGIEEKLNSSTKASGLVEKEATAIPQSTVSQIHPARKIEAQTESTATTAANEELTNLQKRVAGLLNEVQGLKQENTQLKDKLDRIRKIA